MRSWIRVCFTTWAQLNGKSISVDRGLTIASFILSKKNKNLESSLPRSEFESLLIELPLKGEWYLAQGAFGKFSHGSKWAYDFNKLDEAHKSYSGEGEQNSQKLSNFYAYNQPFFASVNGKLCYLVDHHPEVPPGEPGEKDTTNALSYMASQNNRFTCLHFIPKSTNLTKGQSLSKNQELGKVGNSGFTTAPHLHFQIFNLTKKLTVPIALKNVKVRLNRKNCYWETNSGGMGATRWFFYRVL